MLKNNNSLAEDIAHFRYKARQLKSKIDKYIQKNIINGKQSFISNKYNEFCDKHIRELKDLLSKVYHKHDIYNGIEELDAVIKTIEHHCETTCYSSFDFEYNKVKTTYYKFV